MCPSAQDEFALVHVLLMGHLRIDEVRLSERQYPFARGSAASVAPATVQFMLTGVHCVQTKSSPVFAPYDPF